MTAASSGAGLRRISAFEFVRRLRRALERREGRFAWFLGAGCSTGSGVPDAAAAVRLWLRELKHLETGSGEGVEDWASERFYGFDPADPAAVYGKVLDDLFHTEQDRAREIERLAALGEPGFAYATLAQLMTHEVWGEACNFALTANFDDLAADALYLYGARKPRVLTHESFGPRMRLSSLRPTVVKLAGDAHLGAGLDANRLRFAPDLRERVGATLADRTLVFLGYGGRDSAVADLLRGLPEGAPSGGVYWVNAAPPGEALAEWLAERKALWVAQGDFEEWAWLVRREFDLPEPRPLRLEAALRAYARQNAELADREELRRKVAEGEAAAARAVAPAPPPPPAPPPAPSAEGGEDAGAGPRLIAPATRFRPAMRPDPEIGEAPPPEPRAPAPPPPPAPPEEPLFAFPPEEGLSAEEEEAAELARLNLPPSPRRLLAREAALEGERRFQEALRAHPRDAGLMARYAEFLAVGRRDDNAAEHYFNRALDADPNDADSLRLFAEFLWRRRGDRTRAEDCFRLALNADLSSPETLCAYGEFLAEAQGALDAAEDCFRLAREIDPRRADTLRRSAAFLALRRGEEEAALSLLRLAAGTGDPASLVALARHLAERRGDVEGADRALLEALDAAPQDPAVWRARGEFLSARRGDADGARAAFERSAGLDPRDPAAQIAWGRFLRTQGALDAAEERLSRAVAQDPGAPEALTALAEFQEEARGDLDGAEDLYRRAARSAPRDGLARAGYADFLARARNALDAAEAGFRKALAVDPQNLAAQRLYGAFLAQRRGEWSRGLEILRAAAAAAPGDAAVQRDLARALALVPAEKEAARAAFEAALALAPFDARLAASAAAFHAASGDRSAAEALYRRALEGDGLESGIFAEAAAAFFAQGRRADGLRTLDRGFEAMAVGPEGGRRRPASAMLALWHLRYAFDAPRRGEALKASLALIRTGARLEAGFLDAALAQALSGGHPEPETLRALARAAEGDPPPPGLLSAGL
ncbi:tetratricopeptide repeat protein [Neomegalonema sp.]|uniref:tetratricopeptide repeat protein n=1 Tax=Neomegalonema sp. TaxID=2039713 RepID=UPI002638DDC7|nr:tetratricopeptide repeat protein [Neomegalonema sp.]MDD2868062.1 tetratricopeptide repeat protein [Neomegalonema sp.]